MGEKNTGTILGQNLLTHIAPTCSADVVGPGGDLYFQSYGSEAKKVLQTPTPPPGTNFDNFYFREFGAYFFTNFRVPKKTLFWALFGPWAALGGSWRSLNPRTPPKVDPGGSV